ncbi:uncharacterized protein LOC126679597 [Mercurialis annua]|uniref:uncharacterized protein LOC126679597 n=1 Tax=Mercurialis annua TaxID=3986 RepID=UPI0024AEFB12|nr:uncharacterized protein LOC126679597 [Mercurialis annua]
MLREKSPGMVPRINGDAAYYPLPSEKPNDSDEVTGFAKAGFLSRMSFWWLNPLMKKGKQRLLEDEDIPLLSQQHRANSCYLAYAKELSRLKKNKSSDESPSMLSVIFSLHRNEILISGFFALTKVLCTSAGPLFLKAFIDIAEGKQAFEYESYVLTVGLFLAKCLESLSERQWYFRTRLIGNQVRSMLSAAIYQKQLRLSNSAKVAHSPGQIVNLVTSDAYKIGEFPYWFHQIWTTSLQLCLALVIVIYAVGLASVAALIALVVTVIVSSPMVKSQIKSHTKLMAAQDKRLKVITEALANMKVLKLYAWEIHFKNVIERLRAEEFQWIYAVLSKRAHQMVLFWSCPVIVPAITFWTCYFLRIPLSAGSAFTFLACLRILQEPIRFIPEILATFIEAKVSLDRIANFLEAQELQNRNIRHKSSSSKLELNHSITIRSDEISWETDSTGRAAIRNINLMVQAGEKVAICGEVGSGKSTLLAAVLGEVPNINGTVYVNGKIAYVSQAAWIQTGTIQENILFGSVMDTIRYGDVLERCSLVKDLEMLPFGDLTQIGERGVNLSGGQKQRIQLARALYQDADIYLLDDPFSAVDAHTATSLFNEYVIRALSGKTVLLVTHQVDFLPAFNCILLMSAGEIIRAASYDELLASSQEFQDLVNAHKNTVGSEEQINPGSSKRTATCKEEIQKVRVKEQPTEGDQLIKQEGRESGNTGFKPYIQYLSHEKGFFYFSLGNILHVIFIFGQVVQNYWLAANIQNSDVSRVLLFSVYTVIGCVLAIFLLLRAFSIILLGSGASKSIFSILLTSLFRAPMSFYDSTPLGRILSRVSSDLGIIDTEFGYKLPVAAGTTINTYLNFAVLSFLTWPVLFVIIPMVYLSIILQSYYMATTKELMRINGTSKSSVASHLSESAAGVMTIRAFEQEDRFFLKNMELIDRNASSYFHNFSASEWLIQRLELLCAIVLSSTTLALTLLNLGASASGFVGMQLSYGISLNVFLVYSIQFQCSVANQIISMERLEQYMHIPSEAPQVIENNRPDPNWPAFGKLEICSLKVRYRANAPLVLRGITCSIEGGHKIGIVGRTGSGKTTLLSALFRLVEPTEGKIVIDGLNISTIGLHDLRSHFAIIPQDPTLFVGSVRYNLDPLLHYTDQEIWEVLEKCHLRAAIQEKEEGLNSEVAQDGCNWSMGQRQLFCLGRALLKKSKILLLDEATASIDNATDSIIQKTIRSEFAECTVITVAHRIPTVMDCTKVLAISDGKLAEYDEPLKLMSKEGSLFGQLVKEYWSRTTNCSSHSEELQSIFLSFKLQKITGMDPRLHGDVAYYPLPSEKPNDSDEVTGFARAGFLSRMSFWWLNPLMKKGKQKLLEDEDIPLLSQEHRAKTCYLAYTEELSRLKKKTSSDESPSMLSVIFSLHRNEILISGFFALTKVLCTSAGPLFLKAFIDIAEGKQTFEYESYVLTVGLFLAKCLESLSERQWFFRTRLIGNQVRSMLSAAIYQKQLRLSSSAKIAHSPGQIVNLVTSDAYKIGEFPFWFHQIWTTGTQLCLALVIVYYAVGLATVSALIALILTAILSSPMVKSQIKSHTKLMAAQDKRLKVIAEALANMKVLKLYAWEIHFKNVIERLRAEEFRWIYAVLSKRAHQMVLFWSCPVLVPAITFWTCYFLRIPLSAGSAFTFLACLRILQEPIRYMPEVLATLVEAKVSFYRIVNFLEAQELQNRNIWHKSSSELALNHTILIRANEISWDTDTTVRSTLRNINLLVQAGEKVAICGEVGSGKSTLLATVLGEVPNISGTVNVNGKIAYVSQAAWIQTGTIQENILFGSPMDTIKYDDVLGRCSLVKDLEMLPFGDLTQIGERGVNLSGGQKQRIQLARALYQDADIYLLDDPFSAVDAHTATSLFNEYVIRALSGKTVLLVTHQVDFLPAFNCILLMSAGEIIRAASYDELLASSQEFQVLVNAHKYTVGSEESIHPDSSKRTAIYKEEIQKDRVKEQPTEGDQLIKQEGRETGDTGFKPYLQYLSHEKGFIYFSLGNILHGIFILGQVIQNYWLAANIQNLDVSRVLLFSVYTVIGCVLAIILLLKAFTMILVGAGASKSIFSILLTSLFRAPMSFYDSTPLGRILSRVSSDLSIIDTELPYKMPVASGTTINTYLNYAVLAFLTWPVLFVIIPMVYLSILLQSYYLATTKELMRINGTSKSSVASHLSESAAGAMTIRAFEQEERFYLKNMELIDRNASSYFHIFSASEWLIQHLELICAIVLSSTTLALTLLNFGASASGFVGMQLSYGLSLNVFLIYSVQFQCFVSNHIISMERLEQYMHIPSEAPEVIENNRPDPNWPALGKLEICSLKVRYRPNAPLVLRGITCSIEGGHKIGIVGRTGSGKTTLLSALFRLVEPTEGKIVIDGLNIATIGLHDLRSRFAIIPQDPTLFVGSIRYNLDPLLPYTDQEIWEVLDKCHLRAAIQEKEEGLNSQVAQDGSNWSMGQRQLFCLGRALLKKSKILLLDEATASIDNATDSIIQKTIRSEFAECTVITVAHRIPTVMDCTKVLAISDGKLAEYDEPLKLMSKEGSLFGQLVKEYWARTTNSSSH